MQFAALSGDVPARAGAKAAAMLSTELRNTEAVQLVGAKRAPAADPHQGALEQARKSVQEAVELRGKRRFRLAEEALQKAIADYKSGAPGIAEMGELVDAFALLAAVQYNTGRDEEGLKSLSAALALAPSRELPLAKTSALFSRVVEDTRKGLAAGSKGTLLVESTPPGAAVAVDGVTAGSTPIEVREVPAGMHVWKVSLPSGDATGGVVEVSGGKQAKVAAQAAAKDPESRALAALSMNRLDAEVLAAVKEHAGAAGADLVLFGALAREGKGLGLDAFLYEVSNGQLKRLPRSSFDSDLLSAGLEFYRLAGQLSQKPSELGEPAKVPGPVASVPLPSGSRVAVAQYGVEAGKKEEPEEPAPAEKDEGPRVPLEPKKRTPLKKK